MRGPAALALLALAAALGGCPEERAGARRQVPAGRPPADAPVEPAPSPPPGPAGRR